MAATSAPLIGSVVIAFILADRPEFFPGLEHPSLRLPQHFQALAGHKIRHAGKPLRIQLLKHACRAIYSLAAC
jgi:hypothetical protein